MKSKQAYEERLLTQVGERGEEIERLQAKAYAADPDTRLEYYKQIAIFRTQQEEARAKLADLREVDDGSWDHVRTGIESYWESLGTTVKSYESKW
ncbi:MAG: hypothetical protein WDZ76_11245 [Pseudohongiellaceae bacterium]